MIAMEQENPVVIDPNTPIVIEPNVDLRTRPQRACDKLSSCDSKWCDVVSCGDAGCTLPCEILELVSAVDVGCL